MKLKELESILSDVDKFRNPKYHLEQYNTSAHLAARMLYTADHVYDDIAGKCVADLGTGSGILAIAAEILGSGYTAGFDVDPDALVLASENISDFDVLVDLVHCDISKLNVQKNKFDTVIMNPPFGTRTKGIDMVFLQKALEMSSHAVYSMHKSSTQEYIQKKAKDWNVQIEVLAQMKFDVPQMYAFHKKKTCDIQVDLIRFVKKNT